MSELTMLMMIVVSSLCPMALGIGIIVGVLFVIVKKDALSTLMPQSPLSQPTQPDGFTWVYNVSESAIGEVINAMERGGQWRYEGRTHASNRTWHVRFTRPKQALGQQPF